MPRYDSLRTLAFQLNKSTTELTHRFYTLDFPRQWEVEFKQLQGEFNKQPPYKRTLPIENLNQAVQALVPDLISISRYTDIDRTFRKSNSTYRWLFSTTPVNADALHLIIYNWVDIAFVKASSESRQRILGNLKPEALSWNEECVNLADWNTHQNGTAKANNADSFNLLPDWIAAKLSQPDIFLEYGPERLRFRRAPLSAGGRGAEIISWPPIQVEDNEQRHWFYSVIITFSVQTIPFQAHPLIYCDLGIRRWVSQPDTHLGGGQTSVYLLTQVPWVQGLHQSNSFQVASVRWEKFEQPVEGEVNFRLAWSGQLTQLLNNLNPHHPFPKPEQIRQDPLTSLNLESSPNSAIVYSTGMIPSHNVGTGFMPVDRRAFAEQIADLLQPDLTLANQLPKITQVKGKKKYENPFFKKKLYDEGSLSGSDYLTDDVYAKRRSIIGKATDKQLIFELRHQSGPLLETFISHLCETLGLVEPKDLPYTWQTPELTIILTTQHLGELGSELVLNPKTRKKGEFTTVHF